MRKKYIIQHKHAWVWFKDDPESTLYRCSGCKLVGKENKTGTFRHFDVIGEYE